jgi:hypothetical protein
LPRQSAHRWQLGCQPYTPTALYTQKSSGTHLCYRLSKSVESVSQLYGQRFSIYQTVRRHAVRTLLLAGYASLGRVIRRRTRFTGATVRSTGLEKVEDNSVRNVDGLLTDIPLNRTCSQFSEYRLAPRGAGTADRTLQCTVMTQATSSTPSYCLWERRRHTATAAQGEGHLTACSTNWDEDCI